MASLLVAPLRTVPLLAAGLAANVGACGADSTGTLSPIPLPQITDSARGMISISITFLAWV